MLILLVSLGLSGCASMIGNDTSVKQQAQQNPNSASGQLNKPKLDADRTDPPKLGITEIFDPEVEAALSKLNLTSVDPMQTVVIPSPLSQGYQQVEQILADKSHQLAIEKLTQLQISHPTFSGPSYRLARIYFSQKQFELAFAAVEQSIVINPNNYFGFNLKGLIQRERGEFELAKVSYLQAIKIYPRYLNTHLNLAILADIYLYDLPLALDQYQIYLGLIRLGGKNGMSANSDADANTKLVAGWVSDLKRRIDKESSL